MTFSNGIQSADRADDAGGHRVVEAEVADGNGPFPRFELVGVAEGATGGLSATTFTTATSVKSVPSTLPSCVVRKGHRYLIRTRDVFVGEDQAAGKVMMDLALLPLAGGPIPNPTEGVAHLARRRFAPRQGRRGPLPSRSRSPGLKRSAAGADRVPPLAGLGGFGVRPSWSLTRLQPESALRPG